MITLIAASALIFTTVDHHDQPGNDGNHHAHTEASSTVAAEVRTADADGRTAVVSHEALTELGMSAMTMRFSVAETVDFDLFQPGAHLMITVVNTADGFQIADAELSHH